MKILAQVQNPNRENVNRVILRSDKRIEGPQRTVEKGKEAEHVADPEEWWDDDFEAIKMEQTQNKDNNLQEQGTSLSQKSKDKAEETLKRALEPVIKILAPYPGRLARRMLKEETIDEANQSPSRELKEGHPFEGVPPEGSVEKDPLPFGEKTQKIELKTLPPGLKYGYLGEGKKQPRPPRTIAGIFENLATSTLPQLQLIFSWIPQQPVSYHFVHLRCKIRDTWRARLSHMIMFSEEKSQHLLHPVGTTQAHIISSSDDEEGPRKGTGSSQKVTGSVGDHRPVRRTRS